MVDGNSADMDIIEGMEDLRKERAAKYFVDVEKICLKNFGYSHELPFTMESTLSTFMSLVAMHSDNLQIPDGQRRRLVQMGSEVQLMLLELSKILNNRAAELIAAKREYFFGEKSAGKYDNAAKLAKIMERQHALIDEFTEIVRKHGGAMVSGGCCECGGGLRWIKVKTVNLFFCASLASVGLFTPASSSARLSLSSSLP